MKLKHFKQLDMYRFVLTFESGEIKEADLHDLIGQHVAIELLHTAHIDPEWGCLEFLDGKVDIEPNTLYRYAGGMFDQQAA
jgi:hypothetical protein